MLVVRTMSQQLIGKVQAATPPFQNAMATKSGFLCFAHAMQERMDKNLRATVMSIEGISAYDVISRIKGFMDLD